MRKVIIESPYAGKSKFYPVKIYQRWLNRKYARACLRDCLVVWGESPIASHLLYTQPRVLREDVPTERQHGIDAGHAWLSVADAMVVYEDRGRSGGVNAAIERAKAIGMKVEFRRLGDRP